MRVPRALLRDTVTIEPAAGSGAYGPLYGEPASVRASVQATSRLVEGHDGRTITVDTLAILRPEDGPVAPESRLTARGTVYRVVECYAQPDERRPSHYELTLARYAGTLAPTGSGS